MQRKDAECLFCMDEFWARGMSTEIARIMSTTRQNIDRYISLGRIKESRTMDKAIFELLGETYGRVFDFYKANYIAVRGNGNPNEENRAYQQPKRRNWIVRQQSKRLHHEIYMSDARKVAPEKWKTVIRHPIRKV